MIQIKNEFITVGINPKGAELASLISKSTGVEYIWRADPTYWGRHSCILFPVIGAVNQGVININGTAYPMKKHGLVRDIPFELGSKEPDRAVFILKSNEVSKQMYPFDWKLTVTYELLNTKCRIIYEVKNLNNASMPFSIGGHPGLTCPLAEDKKRSDYYLLFDQLETQDSPLLSKDGLVSGEAKRVLDNSNRIDIADDLFDEDALILSNFNSDTVSLVDDEDNVSIRFGIEGFTHLGIWSQGRDSPYVCIEPWMGHADPEGFEGDFYDKPGNVILEKGGVFSCEHWIQIYESI